MSSSPSQNLLSPSPASNLLLSPEPQDSASNHSGQTGDSQHDYDSHLLTSNSNHDHSNGAPKRKPFKTEYKSKFTPFDQYVYNGVTDSFVKQSAPPQQASSVSASKSNQDLSQATNEHHQLAAGPLSISGHEAHVYEPPAGLESQANNEPWYKEVVRRNEKANEYRFKSEVGHNSPLITTRADSPYSVMTDRQFASPGGTESTIGDKMSTISASDARSQLSDHMTDLSQQQQHRFTPSDYKRDHLIAHMANNNNFNLPKEQQEPANLRAAPRRAQPSTGTSGARPSSRVGAQMRSRSQSTRRQPATSSSSSMANNSPSVAAPKSNQTTPTRTSATRVGSTSANKSQLSSVTGATRVSARTTPTSRVTSTSSRVAATARTRTGTTTTPTDATKRAPITPTTATLRITSKQSNGSSPMSGRPALGSAKRTPTVTPTSRTATGTTATSRSAPRSTASASSSTPVAAIRSARTGAPMTRASPATSAKAKTTPKTGAQPASSATTAVKSIKTPKAIAAAKEAGLAASAAALAASAATGVISATSASSEEPKTTITPVDLQTNQEPTQKQPESEAVLPTEHMHYQSEEPNLITTTTEAGNMLADELAQAEKVACEARQLEQLQGQEPIFIPLESSLNTVSKEPQTKFVDEAPIQEQVAKTELIEEQEVKTRLFEEHEAVPQQEQQVEQEMDVPHSDTLREEESANKHTFVVDYNDKQDVVEEDGDESQLVEPTLALQAPDVATLADTEAHGLTLASEEESAQSEATITPGAPQINQEPAHEQSESKAVLPTEHIHYQLEEPDLVTTTSEAGNMLTDDLAREDEVACEARQPEQLQSREPIFIPLESSFNTVNKEPRLESVDENPIQEALPQQEQPVEQELSVPHFDILREESADKHTFIVNHGSERNVIEEEEDESQVTGQTPGSGSVKQSTEELNEKNQDNYGSKELVNGLADGLVSAEDRFDSSERDISSELDDDCKQAGFGAHSDLHVDQNYNDEPYSIMPTTASQARANALEMDLSPTGGRDFIENQDDDIISKLDAAVRDIQLQREEGTLALTPTSKQDIIQTQRLFDGENLKEDHVERHVEDQVEIDKAVGSSKNTILEPEVAQVNNLALTHDLVTGEKQLAEELVEKKKDISEKPHKTLSFNLSEDLITTGSDSSDADKLDCDRLIDDTSALTATSEQDFIQTQKVFADFLTDLNSSSKSLLGETKQEVEMQRFKDDDLTHTNDESNDLIDSSPALVSADTLQDD